MELWEILTQPLPHQIKSSIEGMIQNEKEYNKLSQEQKDIIGRCMSGFKKEDIDMKLPTLDEVMEYAQNDMDHSGWCTNCGDWTHDCCEPDAREYECPVCEENTCYGAEELLICNMYKD